LSEEYGFYLVGAASSREYHICTVLPRFIAAESRSHKRWANTFKNKNVAVALNKFLH